MIKNNQKYLNGLHVVIDAVIITGSYILAWWLKFETPVGNVKPGDFYLPRETYFSAIPYIVASYYRSECVWCHRYDFRTLCYLAAAFLTFHDRHVCVPEYNADGDLPAQSAGNTDGSPPQGLQYETCAACGVLKGGGAVY